MKRIICLIILASLCFLAFSQRKPIKWKNLDMESPNENVYSGYATQTRAHIPDTTWTKWENTDPKVFVYIDMNFGFVAVSNGLQERITLKSSKDTITPDGTQVMYCRGFCKGKACDVYFYNFDNGDVFINIVHDIIEYQYFLGKLEVGYPNYYFNQKDVPNFDTTAKPTRKELKFLNSTDL